MTGGTALWDYAHIVLFVFWLGTELGVLACTAAAKNAKLAFETRQAFVRKARKLHVIPRVCFALILPVGIELTGAINVYPLTPGLKVLFWSAAGLWLVLIAAIARTEGSPMGKLLGYVEIAFQALAGAGFVVYGLNSLATGAPIDEPWFAAKLAMFGLAFWTVIAINVSFRPFFAPFAEIGEEGSTPEREEAVARAVNQTMTYMVVLYLLIAGIAFLGKVKPPF
ncbi:MAG: hypothetical protein AB7E79_03630 [Rhodospirillaceae bacterium]